MGIEKKWKAKIRRLLRTCQGEFVKTTAIGKRMLTASKTNTKLHSAYEELGQLASLALKNRELEWSDPRVAELMDIITGCHTDLHFFEDEVKNLKASPSAKKSGKENYEKHP